MPKSLIVVAICLIMLCVIVVWGLWSTIAEENYKRTTCAEAQGVLIKGYDGEMLCLLVPSVDMEKFGGTS